MRCKDLTPFLNIVIFIYLLVHLMLINHVITGIVYVGQGSSGTRFDPSSSCELFL